jgi:RNA recognition motif-containing protein
LPKDHITGRNKGHAIIEFRRHKDAKTAVKEMNAFDINGKKLKVSIVTDQLTRQMNTGKQDYDLEDDSANQYIHSAQSRALLMQKLSRESKS